MSEGDRRRRYIILRRRDLTGLVSPSGVAPKAVLFVSHNSARSQYAAARWEQRTGVAAHSAGTEPAARVNPMAVRVAAELGLDLSGAVPRSYDSIEMVPDLVVSVCDRARESDLPAGQRNLHWSVPDPGEGGTVGGVPVGVRRDRYQDRELGESGVKPAVLLAELAGTALLLFVVVGSGFTVDSMAGDAAGGLFFHAVVVGLALAALILLFAPVCGAHFNPAVTLAFWRRGRIDAGTAVGYATAQVVGGVIGVAVANVSFGAAVLSVATTDRSGWSPIAAEMIGTGILVLLILRLVDQDRPSWVGPAVGAWVTAMVFSTSSTGFLNPAVTVARTLTDSYTGIAPAGVARFVVAQLVRAAVATLVSVRMIVQPEPKGT